MAGVIINDKQELFRQYQKTKDIDIRNTLVDSYLYIAEIITNKFTNRGIDYDDIYQVACIGLIYAVERFNPDRGVQFATFATPTIMGEIRRYFRDKGCFIRIPRKLYEIFYQAEQAKRFDDSLQTDEKIARRLGISQELLKKAYIAGDTAFVRSLEYEADADGELILSNVLGSDDDGFLMVENSEFVQYCLNALNEKEQDFIHQRFFFEKSQSQIATDWGVSQMYVSRFEKKLIEKLRTIYFKD